MAKVLTFASAKGGSGKTTLTATLGTFLAELNYSVLLVDCDEATNGLTLLYIDQINEFGSHFKLNKQYAFGVFDIVDLNSVISKVNIDDRLDIIPASFTFEKKNNADEVFFRKLILKLISDYNLDYDYIIIDAQAGSDAISLISMERDVSDLVIIVSEYDPLSAAGIERLKGLSGESLSYDRTWILLNKMLPEFVKSFSEFLSVSHYLPPLPWTADVVRAYSKRKLALNFQDGNEFTLAVIQSFKSLPIQNVKNTIQSWLEEKASIIRQPILSQYDDLEYLLNSSKQRINDIKNKKQKLLRKYIYIIFLSFVVFAFLFLTIINTNDNSLIASNSNLEAAIKSLIRPIDKIDFFALFVAILGIISFISIQITSDSKLFKMIRQYIFNYDSEIDDDLELGRLERQKNIYEKKLEELEFLKSADSISLINKVFSP